MRLLILHNKATDQFLLDTLRKTVTTEFAKEGVDVAVVLAREDYAQNVKMMESWKAWESHLVRRVNQDYSPYYDWFVVPHRVIGRATFEIIQLALGYQKKVVFTEDGRTYWPVMGVRRINGGQSWIGFGEVVTG